MSSLRSQGLGNREEARGNSLRSFFSLGAQAARLHKPKALNSLRSQGVGIRQKEARFARIFNSKLLIMNGFSLHCPHSDEAKDEQLFIHRLLSIVKAIYSYVTTPAGLVSVYRGCSIGGFLFLKVPKRVNHLLGIFLSGGCHAI